MTKVITRFYLFILLCGNLAYPLLNRGFLYKSCLWRIGMEVRICQSCNSCGMELLKRYLKNFDLTRKVLNIQ